MTKTLEVDADTPSAGRRRARLAAQFGWVAALCAWAGYRLVPTGFNPTDQGFVLAQSRRILHGEVPHRDIVSARPLGSALLHTVDFLLPGPLFLMSAVVVVGQVALTTIALAALVSRAPVREWGPGFTGLVAAASVVSLHTFPLMAWHTIDGLMLTATGLWALDSGLRSGRTGSRRAGLLVLGAAVLVKQSFVFAVPLGVALVLWRRRRLTPDLALMLLPGALYAGAVAAAGGLRDLLIQLSDARPAYGAELMMIWTDPPTTLPAMAAGAAALAVVRRPRLSAFAVVVAAAAVLIRGGLTLGGTGGVELFWLAVFACGVAWAQGRRVPRAALMVLAAAWMASLSWGYATPALLGGSLVLTAVVVVWPPATRVPAGVGVVAVVAAVLLVVPARDATPYRDLPRDALSADLGTVSPELRGIRTTASTYRYVEQIADCVRRYPAARVAVLPDNAFAYPALGLRNPFPLDWPIELELVGDARARMLATAERLDRHGGYLALFQTVRWPVLAAGGPVPRAVPADTEIVDVSGVERAILARLRGERVTCGSFVGVWAG